MCQKDNESNLDTPKHSQRLQFASKGAKRCRAIRYPREPYGFGKAKEKLVDSSLSLKRVNFRRMLEIPRL